MIVDVSEDAVTYNDPPHRFEAGTPPIVQAIGLGASLAYMEKLGRARIAAHEADLTAYATEKLSAVNALRLIGTAPGKGAIFAFEIEGVHAHDISMLIDRSGRGGEGGHPLRPAVAQAVRRDVDLPRLVWTVQYPCGDRCAGRGTRQGAGRFSDSPANQVRLSYLRLSDRKTGFRFSLTKPKKEQSHERRIHP